jgi:hypothetical protein
VVYFSIYVKVIKVMNAKKWRKFLEDLYGQLGYVVTIHPKLIYKGIKYYIKVDGVEIGACTEFDEEIGGTLCYEGSVAGHGNICLLYSSDFFHTKSRDKKRGDYNLAFTFP